MSKIQDQVKKAQSILNPDGSRKFSDQEIYDKIVSSPTGKKALEAASPEELRTYLGLEPEAPAEQMSGPLRLPAMVGSGLAEGAAATIDMPGEGLKLLNSLVPDEWKQRPDSPLINIPSARGALAHLGLTERADLEPQNTAEKFVKGASQGVGASLPLLPFGGEALTPEFLAAGAASGMGETGMNMLFPNNPLMGLVGSIVGGIGGQSAVRTTEEALAKVRAMDRLKALQGEWDNFDLTFAKENDLRKTVRDTILANADKQFAQARDVAGAAAQAAKAGPMADLQAHASRLSASAMGWQDAGEAMQAEAGKWMADLPKKLESAWETIDKGIPPDRQLDLTNFETMLNSINKSGGAAQPLIDALTPNLSRKLASQLAAIKGAQGMGAVGAFTWDGARQLRSAVGEALGTPAIVSTIGEGRLKALYKALTDDLKGVANAEGLGNEFDAANAASSKLFGIAEGPMARVLGSRSPGEIAKSLAARGATDATDLSVIRAEIPAGTNALAAATLRLNAWGKMTPAAREALVPDAAARAQIDAAHEALNGANNMHAVATSAAKTVADETKVAAKTDYEGWKSARNLAKLKLKADLGAAAQAAKEAGLESGSSTVAAGLNRLSRIAGGGTVGGLLIDALGVNPDALMNSKIGAAIAVGVPAATYGVNQLFRHPDLAAGPLIGLSNAVTGPGAQQRPPIQLVQPAPQNGSMPQ